MLTSLVRGDWFLSRHVLELGRHVLELGRHVLELGRHMLELGRHVLEIGTHVLGVGRHVLEVGSPLLLCLMLLDRAALSLILVPRSKEANWSCNLRPSDESCRAHLRKFRLCTMISLAIYKLQPYAKTYVNNAKSYCTCYCHRTSSANLLLAAPCAMPFICTAFSVQRSHVAGAEPLQSTSNPINAFTHGPVSC